MNAKLVANQPEKEDDRELSGREAPVLIGLGDKVIRNVKFSFLRALITAPLLIVVVPYILKKLGPSVYGAWAIFVALAAFTRLSDFGLGGTLSKYVAQHRADGAHQELAEVLSTSAALYITIAITLAICLNLLSMTLLRFFLPKTDGHSLRTVFAIVTIGASANVVAIGTSAVLNGLQRLDLVSVIRTVSTIVETALTFTLIKLNFGLMGLAIASAAAAFLSLACQLAAILRFLPGVRYRVSYIRFRLLRSLTSFSAKVFVTQIAVLIHTQVDKLFLGHFSTAASVAMYDIGGDLSSKVRMVPELLLNPVLPAASDLDARNNQKAVRDLYARSHKYIAVLGAPLVVFIVAVAPQFVFLWLGKGYEPVAWGIRVLVTTHFINLSTGPGLLIQIGRGQLRPGLYSAAAGGLLNLLFCALFIPIWQFRGALIATGLSVSTVSILFHFWFQKWFPSRILPYLKAAYAKPLVAASALGMAVLWLSSHFAAAWPLLIVEGVLFSAGYILCIVRSRFFECREVDDFERHFRALRLARGAFRFAE